MANIYVYSGATGGGTGADWTNAFTTFPAAYAHSGAAAGDWYFVAHDHNDTALVTTAQSISIRGTVAAPDRIICVNRAVASGFVDADLRNTAECGVTGNVSYAVTSTSTTGVVFIHGINFIMLSGTSSVTLTINPQQGSCEECSFQNLANNGSAPIALSNGLAMHNCSIGFLSAASSAVGLTWGSQAFKWTNDASWPVIASGAAWPTAFMGGVASQGAVARAELNGLDLSGFTGATLITAAQQGYVKLRNCKLPVSLTTVASMTNGAQGGTVELLDCQSGGVIRNEHHSFGCAQTTETAITRVGGATDGTTPYSLKLSTNANTKKEVDYTTNDFSIWNATVGSAVTLTVHLVSSASLLASDIALEADYLGTTGQLISTHASTAVGFMTSTGSALATDTGASWNSPPATPNYQKLTLTFTPQVAGVVRWRLVLVKPSAVIYVCPQPDLV